LAAYKMICKNTEAKPFVCGRIKDCSLVKFQNIQAHIYLQWSYTHSSSWQRNICRYLELQKNISGNQRYILYEH